MFFISSSFLVIMELGQLMKIGQLVTWYVGSDGYMPCWQVGRVENSPPPPPVDQLLLSGEFNFRQSIWDKTIKFCTNILSEGSILACGPSTYFGMWSEHFWPTLGIFPLGMTSDCTYLDSSITLLVFFTCPGPRTFRNWQLHWQQSVLGGKTL
jgi:hypothetical protein